MKTSAPPLKVKSGEGIWLELEDGRRIMDLISSWWVNILGHSHPRIVSAIHEQAGRLEHVIFAGFTHEPAEQLAARLLPHLPDNLGRVFFSDNGSTAVEVALKMAWQFWKNRGEGDRKSFICFEGSYHGDTLGAMSAGSRSVFSHVFSELLFDVHFVPFPHTHLSDREAEAKETKVLEELERVFSENPEGIAGVVIEPLIQGAGGMRMCRKEFMQKLENLVRDQQTLLIYDEVMTGFGRTGDWFATTKTETKPDIICLSKGLTGGFLPLSVTVCTNGIFQAFYSDDPLKTLYHGHSYTANPLGCAAALATLSLLEENPDIFRKLEPLYRQFTRQLQDHENLRYIRYCGNVLAMDLKTEEQDGYLNSISGKIRSKALEKNMLLRPLGNTLYLMPPYCISEEELHEACEGILQIIDEI